MTESLVGSVEQDASLIQHDDAWFQAVKQIFVVSNEETGSSQARGCPLMHRPYQILDLSGDLRVNPCGRLIVEKQSRV